MRRESVRLCPSRIRAAGKSGVRRWPWWCLLVLLGCAVAGCGLWGNYEDPAWIGVHRDDVIRMLGEPVERTPIPGGGQRFVFIRHLVRRPSGTQVAGTMISCQLVVETDSHGIVIQAWRKRC